MLTSRRVPGAHVRTRHTIQWDSPPACPTDHTFPAAPRYYVAMESGFRWLYLLFLKPGAVDNPGFLHPG